MVSILDSIKKLLGIDPSDPSFDDEVIMDINSVFTILSRRVASSGPGPRRVHCRAECDPQASGATGPDRPGSLPAGG